MSINGDKNINNVSFSQEQLKTFFVEKLDLEDSLLFENINIDNVDFQELYETVTSSGMISDAQLQALNEQLANYSEAETDVESDKYLIEQFANTLDANGDGVLSSDEFGSLYRKVDNSSNIGSNYSISSLKDALSEIGIKFGQFNFESLDFLQEQLSSISKSISSLDGSSALLSGDMFDVDEIKNISQMLTSLGENFEMSPDMLLQSSGKSVGDIQSEILTKQTQIDAINRDSNAAILSQQAVLADAIASEEANIEIFADAKAQFESQSQSLDMEIANQSDEIDNQKDTISDKEDLISKNTTAIADAESSIEELESQKDKTLNPAEKIELEEKIAELEDTIIQLEDEIKTAEKDKADAEKALAAAEKAKSDFESQKIALESEYSTNYSDEKLSSILAPAQKVKNEALATIENLKAAQEAEVELIELEISLLQVQLDAVEKAEIFKNQLGNNEFFEYNEEAGRMLAESATENVDEETGNFAHVNASLEKNYGNSLATLDTALEIKEALRGNVQGYEDISQHFKEVIVSKDELSNLPMGAIVVWDSGETVNGDSATASQDLNNNVLMSLGDGTSPKMDEEAEYTVFIPV